MAGYVRQDTPNNIANGNVVDADDIDAEFNAVESAFNASSGHNHDGTSGEGSPIVVVGPVQDFVASSSSLSPKANNTYDLGTVSLQYKDFYLDGIAYLDAVEITGGTIDSTIIGGVSPAAATFTDLTLSGALTTSGLIDGRDIATDGTKLDTVETGADVTDTENVTLAGALMDSELTSEASVKALDQGVATTDKPTFNGTIFSGLSPELLLVETDGTSTHNREQVVLQNDAVLMQTRNTSNTYVATDYRMTRGTSGATNHIWYTNNLEALRVNTAGNIGIGDASPDEKLSVTGNIASTGNIIAGGDIGDTKHFLSLSAFTSWIGTASPTQGQKISVYDFNNSLVCFVYEGSSWVAVENSPNHYVQNSTPGTTNMATAITSADAVGHVTFKEGQNYFIGSNVTLNNEVTFEVGAKITVDTGVTLTVKNKINASETQVIFDNGGTITCDTTSLSTRVTGNSVVYARWFGVPLYDTVTDCAAELQDAVDFAQDLGATLVLPCEGFLRIGTGITFKHGRPSGESIVYDPKVDMNKCSIAPSANIDCFTIVPQCLLSAQSSGDGDALIDIRNGNFLNSFTQTTARAIVVGNTNGWIDSFQLSEIENIGCQAFSVPPVVAINSRHIHWIRVITRGDQAGKAGGGLRLQAQGDNSFIGDMHFTECEFTGDSTHRPLYISAGTAFGSVSRARAIFFDACVFYGEGTLLDAGANSQVHENWFTDCQWDQDYDGGTQPAIKLQTSNATNSSIRQIRFDNPYIVNYDGLAFQVTGTTGGLGSVNDILVRGGMISQCGESASTPFVMQFINTKYVKVHGTSFSDNYGGTTGTSVIDLSADVIGASILHNEVYEKAATGTTPAYFVTVAGTGSNAIMVMHNIVSVGTAVVFDASSASDKDYTRNMSI